VNPVPKLEEEEEEELEGGGVMVFCFVQNFFFGQHKS
jgi:hypothetical protein